jgi:hypothetical protein
MTTVIAPVIAVVFAQIASQAALDEIADKQTDHGNGISPHALPIPATI